MNRVVACALLLAATSAAAKELPPPGPPPDPALGESFDGRPRRRESTATKIALAGPRVLLYPVRFVFKAVRPPILLGLSYGEKTQAASRRALGWRKRLGVSPIVFFGGDVAFAAGGRVWVNDLFGPGVEVASMTLVTGGELYNTASVALTPNPLLPVGTGARLTLRQRRREPFWGLPDEELPNDDPVRVRVLAVDAEARVALRPGGAAGRWRAELAGGFGLRRFGDRGEELLTPVFVPGLGEHTTFLRAEALFEHVSEFDASRRRGGVDAVLSVIPTVGVAWGDESRYITSNAEATWGIPIGRHALVLRGRAGDQPSWGEDPVDFYDLLDLGGSEWLRGFQPHRFRGSSLLATSVDFRTPMAMWLDLDLFAEVGGVFEEHWEGFAIDQLHVSTGAEVRLFLTADMSLRLIAGWGFGDGPRLALSFGRP